VLDLATSKQDLTSPLGPEELLPTVGLEQDLVFLPVSFLNNVVIVDGGMFQNISSSSSYIYIHTEIKDFFL
jgi:hypothetical protein